VELPKALSPTEIGPFQQTLEIGIHGGMDRSLPASGHSLAEQGDGSNRVATVLVYQATNVKLFPPPTVGGPIPQPGLAKNPPTSAMPLPVKSATTSCAQSLGGGQ
jgi:hypothetical protein